MIASLVLATLVAAAPAEPPALATEVRARIDYAMNGATWTLLPREVRPGDPYVMPLGVDPDVDLVQLFGTMPADPRGGITFYPDGALWGFRLASDRMIQGIPCQNGGGVAFHPNGRLMAARVGVMPSARQDLLRELNHPDRFRLPANEPVNGLARLRIVPGSEGGGIFLAATTRIAGFPLMPGTSVEFDDQGGLLRGTVSQPVAWSGGMAQPWWEIQLDGHGRILSADWVDVFERF